MNQQQQYQDQQRMKRLNAEAFWDAVDVSWAEYQAQRPVRKKKVEQEKSYGNQRN